MLKQVNIHEAKTHLSRLLLEVQQGNDIVIAKAGKPIAKLIHMAVLPVARVPGSAAGRVTLTADFHDPLPDATLDAFNGS